MVRIGLLIKWVLLVTAGLIGLALLGIAVIYAVVGNDFSRSFDVAGTSVNVPDDDSTLAEGERLARIRGCAGGCHGDGVNGAIFLELPDGTRVVAPDLAAAVPRYTTEELELLIRHGIRPDRTSVLGVMPSETFYHLSDRDLGAIIAYLRSQEPGRTQYPESTVGPLARLLFFYISRRFRTLLAAERIDHSVPRLEFAEGDAIGQGRYLAATICRECHGENLLGGPANVPSLAIVTAYSLEDFRNLMRTGEPISGLELTTMGLLARTRFVYMNDREVESMHTYLRALTGSAVDR